MSRGLGDVYKRQVVRMASPLEIFGDFFQEMQGRALNAEEQQVMNKIAEEMEEE